MAYLVALLLLAGCAIQPPKESPTKPNEPPIVVNPVVGLPWDGKNADAEEWTKFLSVEIPVIGTDLMFSNPDDISNWCPNYKNLLPEQRIDFYSHLIAKMAQYESNFNPAAKTTECSSSQGTYGSSGKWFPDRKKYCIPGHSLDGGVAVSRGLIQMSLESAQGYGCPLKTPDELHDPKKNLSCAIRILNRFVPHPRKVNGVVRGHGCLSCKIDGAWKGAAAYWAVMRNSSGYAKESHDKIKSYLNSLPMCK